MITLILQTKCLYTKHPIQHRLDTFSKNDAMFGTKEKQFLEHKHNCNTQMQIELAASIRRPLKSIIVESASLQETAKCRSPQSLMLKTLE